MGSREKKKSRGVHQGTRTIFIGSTSFSKVGVAICWINRYSLDNSIGFDRGYLSTGQ